VSAAAQQLRDLGGEGELTADVFPEEPAGAERVDREDDPFGLVFDGEQRVDAAERSRASSPQVLNAAAAKRAAPASGSRPSVDARRSALWSRPERIRRDVPLARRRVGR
jgi:hypothetical protein